MPLVTLGGTSQLISTQARVFPSGANMCGNKMITLAVLLMAATTSRAGLAPAAIAAAPVAYAAAPALAAYAKAVPYNVPPFAS
ncbi:unnamed protein product, partial [Timema podura]|nr:unnamed protein product [Timema podura]